MTEVVIVQDENKSSSKNFKRSFYVYEKLAGDIWWASDKEDANAGILKLWVQLADTTPTIAFVLPDWKITIDNTVFEQKLYEDVGDLIGKNVVLEYKKFRFEFSF